MANDKPKAIPFILCCDTSMTVGLHVALYSLLKNMNDQFVPEIHILTGGLSPADEKLLRDTAENSGKAHKLFIKPFDVPEILRGLPDLRGSQFTFARLFGSAEVDTSRLVYLDSDLLINKDLSELHTMDMAGEMLAARVNGTAGGFIDKQFLCDSMHLNPSTPTFNAGVLVIDLDKWRSLGTDERVRDILQNFGPELAAHDQSVLNALAAGKFARLHESFNVQAKMPRSQASSRLGGQVWHFMGAPKPWEFMAPLVNGFAKPCFEMLDQTAMKGWRPGLKPIEIKRSARNYRYFARHLANQIIHTSRRS